MLPEKEAQAIEARYWHKKTLKSVGAMFGVSRERARQLITKGQKRMKKALLGHELFNPKEQKARRILNGLEKDCAAYLAGEIKTQTEIAAKYGVTRSCISRRVCLARERQGITPTPKQVAARKTYGLRQLIVMGARQRIREAQNEAN
jgi:DNA-directed RNA polymerase specialized sigma subunit